MADPGSIQLPVDSGTTASTIGKATVRVPGVCGELVQGMLGDQHFLVTCPVDFYSRVTIELHSGSGLVHGPPDSPKSVDAVKNTLAYLEQELPDAVLSISNPIPRGKGMGSSSADVVGAIAATGLALGQKLKPDVLGQLAVSVEPSDGVMFPGIALFGHRQGNLIEELGPPPPMEIVALDFGGTVDTLEFNRIDHDDSWRAVQPTTDRALELVREGIREGKPALIGEGASLSAEASQGVLEKPQLPRVVAFSESVGGVGVCVAHSGTVIGVLLDARERRSKSAFRQAQETFPDAEAIHHFRLMSGGVQVVG